MVDQITPSSNTPGDSNTLYEKDGETKTVRDFVVEDLKIERHKIRHRAE